MANPINSFPCSFPIFSNPYAICYDSSFVWVTNPGNNTVTQLNRENGSYVAVLSYNFDTPLGITSDGSSVWVTNSNNNSVTQINAKTGEFVWELTNSLNPSYNFDTPLGITSDGSSVWVTNSNNNSVTQINAETRAFVRNLSNPSYNFNRPGAITSDGSSVWVANFYGESVTQINIENGDFVNTFSYNFDLPIHISSDGSSVWVANYYGAQVTQMNAKTGDFVKTFSESPYNFYYRILGVSSDGSNVWVGSYNYYGYSHINVGKVTQIDAKTGDFVENLSGSLYDFNEINGIISDGSSVWVTNRSLDQFSVKQINAKTGEFIANIADNNTNINPSSLFSDGISLWVTNTDQNLINRYDISTQTWTTINDPSFANPHAITSDGSNVWVLNDTTFTHINASTGQSIETIENPLGYYYLTDITADLSFIFMTNYSCSYSLPVLQYTTNGSYVKSIDSIANYNYENIATDGSNIWITTRDNGNIQYFNTQNNDVNGSIEDTNKPNGISADSSYVWVVNQRDSTITQINSQTFEIITSYPIETPPDTLLNVCSDGTHVWAYSTTYIYQLINGSFTPFYPMDFSIYTADANLLSSDGTFLWAGGSIYLQQFQIFPGPDLVTANPVFNQPFSVSLYTPQIPVIPGFKTHFVLPHQYQLREGNTVLSTTYTYDPATHIMTFDDVTLTTQGSHTLAWFDVTAEKTLYLFVIQLIKTPSFTTFPTILQKNTPFSVYLNVSYIETHQYELREGNTVIDTNPTYDPMSQMIANPDPNLTLKTPATTHNVVFNHVVLTRRGSHTLTYYDATTQQSVFSFVIYINNPICFGKGTDILCVHPLSGKSMYKKIEHLKEGDLVKTYKRGIKKVQEIVQGSLENDPDVWHHCMYKMKKRPGMTGDLMVTGGHSILVDAVQIPDSVVRKQKSLLGSINIEDKYMWLASECPFFQKIQDNETYTYYHIALEHDNEPTRKYGIWANGILTETASEKQIRNDPLIPLGSKKPTIQMQMGIPPR
jgi:streptogramin lyase